MRVVCLLLTILAVVLGQPVSHEHVPCSGSDYMCQNGRCIPPTALGDGYNDCVDTPADWGPADERDDEDETDYANLIREYYLNQPLCSEESFVPCFRDNQYQGCYNKSLVCSDQTLCNQPMGCGLVHQYKKCKKPGFFSCGNDAAGRCINTTYVCQENPGTKDTETCKDGLDESPGICGKLNVDVRDAFNFETPIILEPNGTLHIECTAKEPGRQSWYLQKKRANTKAWKGGEQMADHFKLPMAEGLYGCGTKAHEQSPANVLRQTVKIRGLICSPEEAWQCNVGEVCIKATKRGHVEQGPRIKCSKHIPRSFCELTAMSYETADRDGKNYRTVCHRRSLVSACSLYADGISPSSLNKDPGHLDVCKKYHKKVLKREGHGEVKMYGLQYIATSGQTFVRYSLSKGVLDQPSSSSIDVRLRHRKIGDYAAEERNAGNADGGKLELEGSESTGESISHPVHNRVQILIQNTQQIVYEDFILADPSKITINITIQSAQSGVNKNCSQLAAVTCYAETSLRHVAGIRVHTAISLTRNGFDYGGTATNSSMFLLPGNYNYSCTAVVKYRVMTVKIYEVNIANKTLTKQFICVPPLVQKYFKEIDNLTKTVNAVGTKVNISQHSAVGNNTEDTSAEARKLAITGLVLAGVAIIALIGVLFLLILLTRKLGNVSADVAKAQKKDAERSRKRRARRGEPKGPQLPPTANKKRKLGQTGKKAKGVVSKPRSRRQKKEAQQQRGKREELPPKMLDESRREMREQRRAEADKARREREQSELQVHAAREQLALEEGQWDEGYDNEGYYDENAADGYWASDGEWYEYEGDDDQYYQYY